MTRARVECMSVRAYASVEGVSRRNRNQEVRNARNERRMEELLEEELLEESSIRAERCGMRPQVLRSQAQAELEPDGCSTAAHHLLEDLYSSIQKINFTSLLTTTVPQVRWQISADRYALHRGTCTVCCEATCRCSLRFAHCHAHCRAFSRGDVGERWSYCARQITGVE